MTEDDIERIGEGGTEPTVSLLRRLAAAFNASVQLTSGHDLGSVSFQIAVTPQSACQSGLFRRLGRTRATGRLRGRGDLVQPAQWAQHVRPSVPTLLVLPCEVRRAGN
jgi:hypothetical protein